MPSNDCEDYKVMIPLYKATFTFTTVFGVPEGGDVHKHAALAFHAEYGDHLFNKETFQDSIISPVSFKKEIPEGWEDLRPWYHSNDSTYDNMYHQTSYDYGSVISVLLENKEEMLKEDWE